jgi:N-acetylneuraminic acid mutarotase
MLVPSTAAGNHFGVATDGTNIYTVAGQTGDTYGIGTNTVYRYNIASNTWTKFYANLPEVRYGGVAFIENGWLHFVGGDKADRATPTTDHWAINLNDAGSDWVRKASMPLPGDHISHASINGKVYLFGGEHGHQGTDPSVEGTYVQHNYTFEYNPASDTWVRKADMLQAKSHVEGSTLVINGKAVLIGGLLTGGNGNSTSRVEVYDPVANSWKTLTTRYPKRIVGPTAGYWNGKIYMTDGFSPDNPDRQVGFEGTVKFV